MCVFGGSQHPVVHPVNGDCRSNDPTSLWFGASLVSSWVTRWTVVLIHSWVDPKRTAHNELPRALTLQHGKESRTRMIRMALARKSYILEGNTEGIYGGV